MFWFGGFGLFGIATVFLGNLGTSVGWAMLMSSIIAISTLWGMLTGEWKGVKRAFNIQILSVLALIMGVVIISFTLF